MSVPSVSKQSASALRCVIIAVWLIALATSKAGAVPSYTDQTGKPCASCHVGGFGPQLTPFGRAFKLSGYTPRASDFSVPVSAMAVFSYVHTNTDQPAPPAPHYGTNDNFTLDQANLFLAGGVGDHFGGFAQFTYDGVGRAFSWDNLDLRATDHVTFAGTDILLGLSLNNAPGVQDPWNTLPAWGFPYTDSDLAPAPGAATVLNGGLAQSTLGLNAYAWWNSEIYTEVGLYWTPDRGFMRAVGADGGAVIRGSAPYLRAAYQKDFGPQNFEIGALALFPDLYPGGDRSAAIADKFRDLGVDASYQYMGDGTNIYQVNARYTNESQNLSGTFPLGGSTNRHDTLNEFVADVSYYWHNEVGGTVSLFNTTGSADSMLYAGNRSLKPDSEGFLFQLDGTPFGNEPSSLGPRFNVRLGIQYRLFTRFDGATSNYDGLGHNASDNNTVRVFAWFAF